MTSDRVSVSSSPVMGAARGLAPAAAASNLSRKGGLFSFLINEDVLATVRSLDEQPEEWAPTCYGRELFELVHSLSGLRVWATNRAYGVDIRNPAGSVIWGGVTLVSSVGLSLSHWALSNAIGRWERRQMPAIPSARDILAKAQSNDR